MPLDLIYEARSTSLKHGALPDFLGQAASGEYVGLHQPGGEVLTVMGTIIGAPETDVLRVTSFKDIVSWEASVAEYERSPLVESETVRLMTRSGRVVGVDVTVGLRSLNPSGYT
jgi:hypothetical protein